MLRNTAASVLVGLIIVNLALLRSSIAGGDGERVLFADTFSAGRLDRSHWRPCHWWAENGCTLKGNDELEWYVPGQVRVRGGRLHLVAKRSPAGANLPLPYVSGMVTTGPGERGAPAFAFTYGRAEIRARVPTGRGLWPAFWLLPASRESKPEIDVLELYGSEPRTVRMHLHYRRGSKVAHEGKYWSGLTPGWHRFAIDWRPGRLTWLVDGVARWRVSSDDVPSEPMYLVLNLAVGGTGPGPPDRSTSLPASFAIDWVKVTR